MKRREETSSLSRDGALEAKCALVVGYNPINELLILIPFSRIQRRSAIVRRRIALLTQRSLSGDPAARNRPTQISAR